ncbi:TetR/AcrR family transcriptional regulator [Motilimonas pumila]|uniref:TetR/AcrR family transcriptional regulator n=1 Tax=Motilimonas pumila TaxID=2303987 RepID=A0A418YEA2_9GAMM|nr:TetR/AcrR family transcriptional regulator [Motilimonas pumila]RJG47478.1 TetR/AcrR family transcriptional regulator [Motilimonas pumila]
MPKIVDHQQRRQEIARQAVDIFLQYGYKNLGMRQLCGHLGMSKSAVYHYFTSKDALFRAATEAVVSADIATLTDRPTVDEASPDEKVDNFIAIFEQMAPRYFQEMKLVSDYIEVIGQQQVSQDPCMKLANQKYQDLLAKYVCDRQHKALYSLLLGLLNHQLMLGEPLAHAYLTAQVSLQLSQNQVS